MKLKKKKKSVRMRGTRYHGKAAKKHKGKGNKGGRGMAGTGKRADQKKSKIIRYSMPYFGKAGRIMKRKKRGKKEKVINLRDIEKRLDGKSDVLNFEDYKVLGMGEVKRKMIIKAGSASDSATEKVERAGGKIITKDEQEKKNKKEENADDREKKRLE